MSLSLLLENSVKPWCNIRCNDAVLDGNTTIAGAIDLAGAMDVAGDFSVATNKFNVASATGNSLCAGTLGVTGAITGNLTGNVTGDLTGSVITASQTNITAVGTQANLSATILNAGATIFSDKVTHTDYVSVTQDTSTTTAVTNNANNGEIITFSQSAAADATNSFTVNNSDVVATDIIHLHVNGYAGTYSTNGIPVVNVGTIGAGSFIVNVSNAHGANALSGALTLRYRVSHTV